MDITQPRHLSEWLRRAVSLRGMVVLLISGMFDLSVGSMFSMAGVLTGWLLTRGQVPARLRRC